MSNSCRKNQRNRKSLLYSHYSNNSGKNHQWSLISLGKKLLENQIFTQSPSITPDYILITKEKGHLYKKNLAGTALTKWSNLTSPMMGQADIMCTLCCDTPRGYIIYFVFLLRYLIWMKKQSDKSKLMDILQKPQKNKKLVLTLKTKEDHVWVFQLAARTRNPAISKH